MWEWLVKYWLEVLFGCVTAGVGIALRQISKNMKKEKERSKAIEDGVRDILRINILDTYDKCKTEGKITVSRKDAIDSAYQSYHALGGNGTITQVHNEIMEMPIIQ